ncbi:MAG: Fic family protein, partial [Chloroflexi bacterium]|nr:Fic family protein [Chloroflexota bacterium]
IRPFVRREAVLSSRIEGTQASLSDLFLYEATTVGRPKGDVAEVANYVRALEHGLGRLEKLPICVRLTNEMHGVLLDGVRGAGAYTGKLREHQVWIGSQDSPLAEATYIPPPAGQVRDLLQDWEEFVNLDSVLPPLVQCALMHYQFEAIHPYVDVNGRLGRLLVILFLCAKDVLTQPLLYLSAYFERNRNAYYDQLFRVSVTGDWQTWIRYFLDGVVEQARDALHRARQLRDLHDTMRESLQNNRESANALVLLDILCERPFMTAPTAARLLDISPAGARRILDRFAGLGMVEYHSETWPRRYVFRDLLEILDAPIQPG